MHGAQWVFSVLLPATWLLRKRAAHATAVHWDCRRPPAATPCFLPGSSNHREDRFHHQPRNNTFQHQSLGNSTSSREQHESTVRPRHRISLLAVSPWSHHLVYFCVVWIFFLYTIFLFLFFLSSLCNSRFSQLCWNKLSLIGLTTK